MLPALPPVDANLIPFYLLPYHVWQQTHNGLAAVATAALALGLRTGLTWVARRAPPPPVKAFQKAGTLALPDNRPDGAIRPDHKPLPAVPPVRPPRGVLVLWPAFFVKFPVSGPLIGLLMLQSGRLLESWIGPAWKTALVEAGSVGMLLAAVAMIVELTLLAPRRTGHPL